MESQLTHPGKGAYPMLLVNGERDTQQPIAGPYLMMKHGDPKNAWVNPQGAYGPLEKLDEPRDIPACRSALDRAHDQRAAGGRKKS